MRFVCRYIPALPTAAKQSNDTWSAAGGGGQWFWLVEVPNIDDVLVPSSADVVATAQQTQVELLAVLVGTQQYPGQLVSKCNAINLPMCM